MSAETTTSQETFRVALEGSRSVEKEIRNDPAKFRCLAGDRPTGPLHIGHIFGSVRNRVRLQELGVETFVLIADYQVLTDRDDHSAISGFALELTADYLALGLDPECGRTCIFPHSQVPELNQLLVAFLGLVSMSELMRNPTVKEEIRAAGLKTVKAGMFVYPVHQAADILSCRANVVPVGRDQLPHLEIVRSIARRFNRMFSPANPVFPEPAALLSEAPRIAGLDGSEKMGKSGRNAVSLSHTEDETAELIRSAKTDAEPRIGYDPEKRPGVSNLLLILSMISGEAPGDCGRRLESSGASGLKKELTEALNEYLRPFLKRRAELAGQPDYLRSVLEKGAGTARRIARETLGSVLAAMNMDYHFSDGRIDA